MVMKIPKVNVSIDQFGAVKTPEGTEAIIKITNDSILMLNRSRTY